MSTAGNSRMVHDAFSERQQQQGGDERHWIPLAKMMGGCIPPIPPAVDAPVNAHDHIGLLTYRAYNSAACTIRHYRAIGRPNKTLS